MTDKKCQIKNHEILAIEDVHLKAVMNRTAEEGYIENFMSNLKSKVCCDKAKLPYLVLVVSGMILKFTGPGKNHITLTDILSQLTTCKESMLKHANCPK